MVLAPWGLDVAGANETETQEKTRSTGYGECYMIRDPGVRGGEITEAEEFRKG